MFESRPIDVVTENNQLSSITENPKNLFEKLFSFDGRTNRLGYFGLTVLQIFIFTIFISIAFLLVGFSGELSVFICILCALFYLVSFFAVGARRQHDFGRSGWFQLLGFIPVAGVFITLSWFFFAGEKGTNQYGEEPN